MSSPSTIVTKSMNRNGGLKIRNPPKISAEQEKRLRDQLHAEIAIKTKACSNIAYECSLPRIDGYDYCIRHILQDPQAPYKQCTFLLTNGKRCLQPAPKYDPKKDILTSFCFEHSRQSQLTKTRTSIGKLKLVETNETILNDLSHHVNLSKSKQLANNVNSSNLSLRTPYDPSEPDRAEKPYVDPFVDINATIKNSNGRRVLDYASDSSSDPDVPTVNNTWRGQDLDNSDNESIDSQNEDLLKHAEIYTSDQVTKITKEKLIRLRTLYIDQLYRLKHVLREKRRAYLHSLKGERDALCSIHDQPKDTIRERRLYEKLKALNKYHKRTGLESIMYKKFTERRQKSRDLTQPATAKPPFHTRCIFTEGGVKCGDRIIPCSKYCRKHILEDKKQVLFRACNIEKGGVVCQEPIPNIFEDASCVLHYQLPPQRNYTQKKYESESDEEMVAINADVKKEETQSEENTPKNVTETATSSIANEAQSESFEDLGTNVTICHDQPESSIGQTANVTPVALEQEVKEEEPKDAVITEQPQTSV